MSLRLSGQRLSLLLFPLAAHLVQKRVSLWGHPDFVGGECTTATHVHYEIYINIDDTKTQMMCFNLFSTCFCGILMNNYKLFISLQINVCIFTVLTLLHHWCNLFWHAGYHSLLPYQCSKLITTCGFLLVHSIQLYYKRIGWQKKKTGEKIIFYNEAPFSTVLDVKEIYCPEKKRWTLPQLCVIPVVNNSDTIYLWCCFSSKRLV